MRETASLALALLTLLIGACGRAPGELVQPPAQSRSVAPATHVLREADAGGLVTVHPGDIVELQLVETRPVPGSSLTWEAVSDDPGILVLTAERRDPAITRLAAQSTYHAIFTARAAGTATISVRGHRTCEAMNPAYCTGTELTYTVAVNR